MAEPEKHAKQRTLALPVMAASPVDVGRLVRELEMIDNTLMQLGLRAAGTDIKLPKTSHLMDQIAELNKLNLLHAPDRVVLQKFLAIVKQHAPVVHISFSTDPPVVFIEKLMVWLRREIHPFLLLTIGLQPTIGAGCIVRTTNKQFDFSLRQDFLKKRDLLLAQLAEPATKPNPEPVEAAA